MHMPRLDPEGGFRLRKQRSTYFQPVKGGTQVNVPMTMAGTCFTGAVVGTDL